MEKINAVITGVGGYVPDYVLTNDEISRMVDTNDEWIMTRIGVKERRILNEEGLGSSYMARKAAKQLMQRTGADPDDIDLVIVATSTPDYHFPSTASILCDKLRLKNAYAFDLQAACSGFLYLMETAANFIRSGRYKKVIIVGADKMSSMVDYTDRATCPIFGDGAAAFMLEPTTEDVGIMDAILRTDGKGLPFLHMKAGGSVCPPSYFTVDNHSIDDTKIGLVRNHPVNAILCQTVFLGNGRANIRHIGYGILKHSTSFLINVMHVVVYSKIRGRTNRPTRFHMQERQTFAVGSQNSIHNTYIFCFGSSMKAAAPYPICRMLARPLPRKTV